ncbi:helicase-related protein [Glacieibacterium megasporae]|uniref:helicase-related protein n=1 Tax=Glacieibacterium megasporae TaxID=2835787 RepID=UPI0021040FFE|nr:helicase-related protein [Polymorphobacter megasporae]
MMLSRVDPKRNMSRFWSAFKDDRSILIATESGAEGISLQFCSLLINYDLPSKPQRVEQRIGRCDR